jgi:L-asparagine transporter-like permease
MHLVFKRAPSELPEIDNIRVPRGLQILSGAFVGVFAILCGAAALVILVVLFWHKETKIGPFLALSTICALLTGASIYLFRASYQLLTGRGKQGGYSSPRALRMTSYSLVVLALLVLVLSLQSPRKLSELIAALIYLWVARCLWKFASQREILEHNQPSDSTPMPDTHPARNEPRIR